MRAFTPDPFRDIASALSPVAVSQFLAAESWHLERRQDHVRELWTAPDGDRAGRILLPLATDYADFPERFSDALSSLARIHGWDPERLQERIAAARADLFYVRLDQSMTDGTIPLSQAESTLEGILKMLRAAATTAASPDHSHRGKRPAAVKTFLDEDVRLGHTKRGSFIFTVVTRLGDVGQTQQGDPEEPAPAVLQPFSRRVMETLATGLETTHELALGHNTQAFDDPGRWGLSSELVDSILEIAQPEQLRGFDLSFEWSASEPRPSVGATTITWNRDAAVGLATVRERLARKEEPPSRETVVGFVRSLTREDGDNDEMGSIVLNAEVRGKVRKLKLTLTGDDHEFAIRAYREKIPLTASGILVSKLGAWRLDDASIDGSFLEYRDSHGITQTPSDEGRPD